MMNQDQYHASLLGKKLETEVGWGGITRASRPKPMAPEPPNTTDPEQSIEQIKRDDPEMRRLNLNNIKVSVERAGSDRIAQLRDVTTHDHEVYLLNGLCFQCMQVPTTYIRHTYVGI